MCIYQIKGQKQRPNIKRIVHIINKMHPKLTEKDITVVIEEMVEHGRVVKLMSGQEWSYRDPVSLTPKSVGRMQSATPNKPPKSTSSPAPAAHVTPSAPPREVTLIPKDPLQRHKMIKVCCKQ